MPEPPPGSSPGTSLSQVAGRPALEPGQVAHVRAKSLAAAKSARLEVWADKKLVQSQELTQASTPGRFSALLKDLPEGDYTMRLTDDPGLEVPLHAMSAREGEMRDVSGDARQLKTLAESSGGELLQLSQLSSLAPKLARQRLEHYALHERSLWDSGYLMLFVVGCLGIEWSLRKRLGLA